MQTLPVLLASGSNYFGTLFWLLFLPVIVWFLIWLLLKSDESDKNLVLDESAPPEEADDAADFDSSEEAVTTAPSADVKGPPPPPGTAPKTLATGSPSRAFTVWTHPAPTTGSKTAEEVENEDGEADRGGPIDGPPSQAFTIWTKPATGTGEDSEKKKKKKKKKDDSIPELDTATAEEAAAQFQEDLDSGIARQDAALGILYESQPAVADDLKEIKGVAKVLEGKLHDFGIYQFRQIAFWTDTAVAEFAQRLTFKDRIYKDDWIAQAKRFHEEKYGEKL